MICAHSVVLVISGMLTKKQVVKAACSLVFLGMFARIATEDGHPVKIGPAK